MSSIFQFGEHVPKYEVPVLNEREVRAGAGILFFIAIVAFMNAWLTGDFSRITVPGLPRRVVGWVQRKRPRPGPPTREALNLARELIIQRGGRQPGLHVGADAFPLKTQ